MCIRDRYRSKNLPRLNIAESSDLSITEEMTLTNTEDKKIGNLVKVINLENKSVCLISAKEKNYLEKSLKVKETNSTLTIS